MTFKKLSTLIGTGLIALSLQGCSTPSNAPEIVYKTRLVGLPTHLLQDCTRADLGALRTNADLVRTVLAQDEALASCNADKEAIRSLMPKE